MSFNHIPVLLSETLQLLEVKNGDTAIDATLGGGGYTIALLNLVGQSGRIISIDADEAAIDAFRKKNSVQENHEIVHDNFTHLMQIAGKLGVSSVNRIVADIGVSSYHFDASGRGFSFQKNELLDMRMNQALETTAADIIAKNSQEQLAEIFFAYGEEPRAYRIAQAILKQRIIQPITTTSDLFHLLNRIERNPIACKNLARRIFQALRIAVNQELEALENFLPQSWELLAPNGRLAVVTFHSLEDRIVKHFFQNKVKTCICPPAAPICVCNTVPSGMLITKRPIRPFANEIKINSRAKSAKLRVIQKLKID